VGKRSSGPGGEGKDAIVTGKGDRKQNRNRRGGDEIKVSPGRERGDKKGLGLKAYEKAVLQRMGGGRKKVGRGKGRKG